MCKQAGRGPGTSPSSSFGRPNGQSEMLQKSIHRHDEHTQARKAVRSDLTTTSLWGWLTISALSSPSASHVTARRKSVKPISRFQSVYGKIMLVDISKSRQVCCVSLKLSKIHRERLWRIRTTQNLTAALRSLPQNSKSQPPNSCRRLT